MTNYPLYTHVSQPVYNERFVLTFLLPSFMNKKGSKANIPVDPREIHWKASS